MPSFNSLILDKCSRRRGEKATGALGGVLFGSDAKDLDCCGIAQLGDEVVCDSGG